MKTLELKQMETFNGGVTVQVYCATLKMIMDNNPITESMTFFYDYFSCSYYNNPKNIQ
jgi:hypothetical protein